MRLFRICSGRWFRTLSVMASFVLVLGLAAPTTALAADGEEGNTGFIAGVETLVSPDTVNEIENDPVRDYDYVPVLRDVEPAELSDEATTMDSLSSVITACNGVQAFSNQKFSLLDSIVRMSTLSYANAWLIAAVGIVFMWWGVRKAVRIIKSAWYKGHASV